MARYIKDFQVNADPQTVHYTMDQYLQQEGYEYISFDGENVFKKGDGFLTNPSFFKFSYTGNTVRMETWMKYAFLPGVYIGELGVDGFVGCAVKGTWKKRISYIENVLNSFSIQNGNEPLQFVPNNINQYNSAINSNGNFAEATANAFCTNCGAPLNVNEAFCTKCGKKRSEANPQGAFNQGIGQNTFTANGMPVNPTGKRISRKEFIDNYVQPSLKKNITNISYVCYFCAAVTFIMACIANPWGIIDAVALGGFALGMHLTKSRVFGILIFLLSVLEVILSINKGSAPVLWVLAGISALVTFSRIEKQYKQFIGK